MCRPSFSELGPNCIRWSFALKSFSLAISSLFSIRTALLPMTNAFNPSVSSASRLGNATLAGVIAWHHCTLDGQLRSQLEVLRGVWLYLYGQLGCVPPPRSAPVDAFQQHRQLSSRQ